MTLSKNAIAIIVGLFSAIGLQIGDTQIVEVISAIGSIVSFAILIWHQFQRRDSSGFFFKE